MKRTFSTAFHQPNNNTDILGEDEYEYTDNDPAPKPVPPTMHVRDATPDPIAPVGLSPATPIHALGPITQPLLVSRGQTTGAQQASESTQQMAIQAADVNLADENGQTRLMLAARDGDLPTVQALLSHGANVNLADNKGWTALMFAARPGHLAIAQALLGAPGIDIDAKKDDGATALLLAAVNGHCDLVKALIEKGAGVNAADNKGWTPLMAATSNGYLAVAQALLGAPGINIDAKKDDGATALYLAALNGHSDVVKALIDKDADVNFATDGWTPLMAAISEGHLTTVQALLDAPEIDIEAKNHEESTALYLAAVNGHCDLVKALLDHGADINETVEEVKTALHNLDDDSDESSGMVAAIQLLMDYLAQRQANVGNLNEEATWASSCATSAIPPKASEEVIPSFQALELDTLLQQAQVEVPSLLQISFQANRDQLLQLKLSAEQVANLIYMLHNSPFASALVQTLAVAIKLGGYPTKSDQNFIDEKLNVFRLLDAYKKGQSCLDSGNINRWQTSGQTLLTRAAQAGDLLLVDALITCGATISLPDQHGNNALHAAVKAGKWSVCSHLLALGANPNTSDRSGVSTLTYLAQAFARGDEQTAAFVASLLGPLLAKGHRLDRVVNDPDDLEEVTCSPI